MSYNRSFKQHRWFSMWSFTIKVAITNSSSSLDSSDEQRKCSKKNSSPLSIVPCGQSVEHLGGAVKRWPRQQQRRAPERLRAFHSGARRRGGRCRRGSPTLGAAKGLRRRGGEGVQHEGR